MFLFLYLSYVAIAFAGKVIGNIQPRYPFKERIYPRPVQIYPKTPETTHATEDDMYNAGWIARDVL
jgi:hypothetical protein